MFDNEVVLHDPIEGLFCPIAEFVQMSVIG